MYSCPSSQSLAIFAVKVESSTVSVMLDKDDNGHNDDDNVSGGQDVCVLWSPGAASLRGWGPGQGGHSVGQVRTGGQEGGGGHLLGVRGLAQVKSIILAPSGAQGVTISVRLS